MNKSKLRFVLYLLGPMMLSAAYVAHSVGFEASAIYVFVCAVLDILTEEKK